MMKSVCVSGTKLSITEDCPFCNHVSTKQSMCKLLSMIRSKISSHLLRIEHTLRRAALIEFFNATVELLAILEGGVIGGVRV